MIYLGLEQCVGKQAFDHRGAAAEAIRHQQLRGYVNRAKSRTKVVPYRCNRCCRWHIGARTA